MSLFADPGRLAAVVAVTGLVSACGTSMASVRAPDPSSSTTVPVTVATQSSTAAVDRLVAIARQRYAAEVNGPVTRRTLHRVAEDPTLLRTLQSGDLRATRAYVARQFGAVWYHWHVSRMRIVQGSRVVVDAGVPFVVAPSQMTLRGTGGRALGTLQVSIQDEIGFVRFMHRNYPVDVVVRGQGPAHVRSSLPAASQANLPSRGPVTIAGRRYVVRHFHEVALAGEPVTAWVLVKG